MIHSDDWMEDVPQEEGETHASHRFRRPSGTIWLTVQWEWEREKKTLHYWSLKAFPMVGGPGRRWRKWSRWWVTEENENKQTEAAKKPDGPRKNGKVRREGRCYESSCPLGDDVEGAAGGGEKCWTSSRWLQQCLKGVQQPLHRCSPYLFWATSLLHSSVFIYQLGFSRCSQSAQFSKLAFLLLCHIFSSKSEKIQDFRDYLRI